MRIVNLFGRYFLILVVIQGLVLSLIDSKSLRKAGMPKAARKAKIIGRGIILAGGILFVLHLFI